MSNQRIYSEIYEYLSTPETNGLDSDHPATTVVFGRDDTLLAGATAEAVETGIVDSLIITGGVGKDSGNILRAGYGSEATFLYAKLQEQLGPTLLDTSTFLETSATNGNENARFAGKIALAHGLPTDRIHAIAHGTSLRRLSETLRHEVIDLTDTTPEIYRTPTGYNFDTNKKADQTEAIKEILRLIHWPEKDWLQPQVDIPPNLKDFALDSGLSTPPRPSRLAGAVLRMVPPAPRIKLLQKLS